MKRRRQKRTNYRQRLKLLKSGKNRLVIRKKHNNFHIQLIQYNFKGDKTLVEVASKALVKQGWKGHCGSIPAAYLLGLLAGKKAQQRGIKSCVVDIGLHAVNASSLYAAAKGVSDSGVNVPLGFSVDEDRIKGVHIAEYAKKLKSDEKVYKKQFSSMLKSGVAPENIAQHFEEVKATITKNSPEKKKVEA